MKVRWSVVAASKVVNQIKTPERRERYWLYLTEGYEL